MAEINTIIDQITHWGLTGLWKLVFAVIIWFVGKKVISISLRLLKKIFDKGREIEKLDSVKNIVSDPANASDIAKLYEQIMSGSRKIQYRIY